tara:strand:- start:130 stop:291 length:162 start_codon:yes stop_codon:yes gene_type:complete
MAGHKPNEKMKKMKRKPMMYGSRKPMKKGKMPRYGMFDGGQMVKSSMPEAGSN